MKYSCDLYLACLDLTDGLQTLSEISYEVAGRGMIIWANFCIFSLCVGLMFAYYNLFGDIFSSFMQDFLLNTSDESIFASEYFAIGVLAVFIFPSIFDREMKELEYLAHLLFIATCVFVLTLFVYTLMQWTTNNPDVKPMDHFHVFFTRKTVTCFSIFVVAFNFQLNLYSTYSS